MFKKMFITFFFIIVMRIFSLGANECEEDPVTGHSHALYRIIEHRHDVARSNLEGVLGHDEPSQHLHFYYLGKVHAYREMRYLVLPMD